MMNIKKVKVMKIEFKKGTFQWRNNIENFMPYISEDSYLECKKTDLVSGSTRIDFLIDVIIIIKLEVD